MADTLRPGDRVSTEKGEKGVIATIQGSLADVRLDSSLRKKFAITSLRKITDERIQIDSIYRMANGQIIQPLEFVAGKWRVQLWYGEKRRWGESPILIESRYIGPEVDPPDQQE